MCALRTGRLRCGCARTHAVCIHATGRAGPTALKKHNELQQTRGFAVAWQRQVHGSSSGKDPGRPMEALACTEDNPPSLNVGCLDKFRLFSGRIQAFQPPQSPRARRIKHHEQIFTGAESQWNLRFHSLRRFSMHAVKKTSHKCSNQVFFAQKQQKTCLLSV